MSRKSKQNESDSASKSQCPQSMQALLDLELVNLLESKKAASRLFLRAADAACDPRLRRALRFQIVTAMMHADNIESLLADRPDLPEPGKSEVMDGLRKEANEITSDKNEDEHKDIRIISILQRIKHVDMASCGTAAAHARLLGDRRAASVLRQAVCDEKASDQCLTNLCMQLVGEPEREPHAVDFISNLAHWIERKKTMPYYGSNRGESRDYEGEYGGRGGRSWREPSRRQGRYEDEGDYGYEGRGYRSGQMQERDEYGQFSGSGRGRSRYQEEGGYGSGRQGVYESEFSGGYGQGGYGGSQGGYGGGQSSYGSQGGYGGGQSSYGGQGGYGGGYESSGRGSRGGYGQGRGEYGRSSRGGSSWGNSGQYEDDERSWRGQSGYGGQYESDEDYRGGYSQRQGGRGGSFGGYEGRSRGGRHSSQMQERDEYGQFAGSSGRGGWEYDEDEGRDYSRRQSQSRGSYAGR